MVAERHKWVSCCFLRDGCCNQNRFSSHRAGGEAIAAFFVKGLDPRVEQLPFSLTIRFFCVLETQKGMPSLLKTTVNAIYMVPVATLCKGNERMTRIKILCDLSQQQMGSVIE